MKPARLLQLAAGVTFAASFPAQAAPIITLNDVEAQRVLDTTVGGDNTGDSIIPDAIDVGIYTNGFRAVPVFVFQMTGVSNPSQITGANFSVFQTLVGASPNFDVQAHAVRTSATSTVLPSDYQDSSQLLMSNFDNNNANNATVSLDSAGQTTLGSWLASNWTDGNYVFIKLKSDPANVAFSAMRVLRYGDNRTGSSDSWTTAQLNVTVTDPSSFSFTDWADANAIGQAADQDHDNDGVKNGIEYFMGETGSSFTPMPGPDATNKVTWAMSSSYEGTYEVQTSPDLVTWTNVDPRPTPSGGTLSYTLPTGLGTQFVRLLVTPTP